MDIQVLKLNSTTMTIMTHTYPGSLTTVNRGRCKEDPGLSEANRQGTTDLTITHYIHQHEGADHFNPISHRDIRNVHGTYDNVVTVEHTEYLKARIPETSRYPTLFLATGHNELVDVGSKDIMRITEYIRKFCAKCMPPDTEGLPEDTKSITTSNKEKRTETSTDKQLGKPDLPGQAPRDKGPAKRTDNALEKNRGLMQFQIDPRRKLTPGVWITSEATVRWMSGQNRYDPCHKLASLNTERIEEWIGHNHNLTSFLQG